MIKKLVQMHKKEMAEPSYLNKGSAGKWVLDVQMHKIMMNSDLFNLVLLWVNYKNYGN